MCKSSKPVLISDSDCDPGRMVVLPPALDTLRPEPVVTFLNGPSFRGRRELMRAGLALNPSTPISVVEEVAPELDVLLIMSVNPGFGGQTYWPGSAEKIKRARALLDTAGTRAALEVDGGVNRQTIVEAFQAGADTFVAGTAVFGALNIAEEIRELRRRCVPSP